MTATKLPAWLELDTGAHAGSCGVCVEECLALLLGQEKSDHPDRVHPIIRDLAIRANDAERDPKKRRLLARTLACQVDTDDVTQDVTNRLAAFVCLFAAERLPEDTDERIGTALRAAAACLENRTPETIAWAAGAAEAARAAGAARAAEAAEAAWAAEAAEAARAARAAWAARAARAARAAWAAWAAEAAEAAGAAWAAWAAEAAEAAWAAEAAEAAGAAEAARAAFFADLLIALIAEFDRLTGRTECHKFTKADWDRVKAALR